MGITIKKGRKNNYKKRIQYIYTKNVTGDIKEQDWKGDQTKEKIINIPWEVIKGLYWKEEQGRKRYY